MNIADFLFTIGYQGNTAIVDRKARSSMAGLSPEQLLERGMFKPAFAAAVAKKDPAYLEQFLARFNAAVGTSYRSVEDLKRLFGVYAVPEGVARVTSL